MEVHEQIAESLGLPLFTSSLYIPEYREGNIGSWRINYTGFCIVRGYYSGLWAVYNMPVLCRCTGKEPPTWETWMSLTPHEIESQEQGCRNASGHTVIMGLGMGWVAINVALNPAVKLVTVIEYDPEVIDLFEYSGALDNLPDIIRRKIQIIEADALEWLPAQRVNFLYVDIWLNLAEPQTLDEVCCIQNNVKADQIYFWGQELTIYSKAKKLSKVDEQLNEMLIRSCIRNEIALPLLVPPNVNYSVNYPTP